MNNRMNKLPSIGELKQYAVNNPGEYEITRQTLYDTLTYDAAGQSVLTFFQDPIGQNSKTKSDTNMEAAGQLPQPKNFIIESIEIIIYPGVLPVNVSNTAATDAVVSNFQNDIYSIMKQGNLDLFIGSKSYLTEAPIGKFPPKANKMDSALGAAFQMKQAVAADESGQIVGDYGQMCGRPYFIDPSITLIPTQNFNITLNWPEGVQALPSGQDARIQVCMDGLLYRWSQ